DLVDRGTEFGLDVAAGGRTEVHVFRGKVELYDAGSGRAAPPRNAVATGEGVRLDDSGAVRPIALDPAAFRSTRDLVGGGREQPRRRREGWEAASDALRRDPSVLVYPPFQSDQSWSRTLRDEAGGRHRPHDGAIVGCAWATGRWPGKQGLEFK